MGTHFRGAQVALFYPQVDLTHLEIGVLNEISKELYLPANVIQNADGDPLVMLLSQNGNSQIFVTQYSLALQVAFTPDWQPDPQRGEKYLIDRIRMLLAIMTEAVKRNILYSGISIDAAIESHKSDAEIVKAIQHWIGTTSDAELNISDISFKRSIVEDDALYLNIFVGNYRDFSRGVMLSPQLRLDNKSAVARGISVNIDYNNRYSYNIGGNPEITEEYLTDLIRRAFVHTKTACDEIASHFD